MTDRLLQFDLSADDQALFPAELDELLQRVEESLVDLERAPDDQGLLNEIFRAANTIKGSSATVGHARMAALTHAMETRLDDVRKRVAAVTPQLIEALLNALDVLKLLRDEVQTRIGANADVDAVAGAVERRASPRAPVMKSRSARRSSWNTPTRHTVFTSSWKTTPGRRSALQVLLVLSEHGKVLASQPTQAEIETEDSKIGSRLMVLVRSDKPEQVLLDSLNNVPELGSITVESIAKQPLEATRVAETAGTDVAAASVASCRG